MSGKRIKQQRRLDRQHNLFWGSSYDRGLDILLFMWPDILEKYPDAELHICYGWELFDKISSNNPERVRWRQSVEAMMTQKGVFHHGRLGKNDLEKVRKSCGIWAYPTYFTEIDCITAKDAQKDGLIPVATNLGALAETVKSGILVDGDIKDPNTQQRFLDAVLEVMGLDDKAYLEESEKAKASTANITWSNSADKWLEVFNKSSFSPLVTVCTVTLREGFWNIMADNIASQTYKNIEWVIVDDYKEDRSHIAKKYAKKYGLKIKYLRGEAVKDQFKLYKYGLVRANNKAWKNAEGELIVFLQDFILMPKDGIENLVTLYKHHPNSLLAPVDQYWFTKTPNLDNKEDWWDGETDIIDDFSWRNIRVQFLGLRKTDNSIDFEMNYGAIPRHILEKLNGWWEFFDDVFGYDNTEIAYRSLLLGYDILIDDTNIAKCIDLRPITQNEREDVLNKGKQVAVPYWLWLKKQLDSGKLPIIRDQNIDSSIHLNIELPSNLSDDNLTDWVEENMENIIDNLGDYKDTNNPIKK